MVLSVSSLELGGKDPLLANKQLVKRAGQPVGKGLVSFTAQSWKEVGKGKRPPPDNRTSQATSKSEGKLCPWHC